MTSFIAAGGSGRSTSVIPAAPAASSVTTIAFIRDLPVSSSRLWPTQGQAASLAGHSGGGGHRARLTTTGAGYLCERVPLRMESGSGQARERAFCIRALQVHRRDPEVDMAALALDDHQRHALAR